MPLSSKPRKLFLAVVLGAAVGGCASSPPALEFAEPPRASSRDLVQMVQYFEEMRLAPAPKLSQEYARVRRDYAAAGSTIGRLKLGILLSIRHAPFRDDTQARDWLVQAMNDESAGAKNFRALAAFLMAGLDERHELERTLDEERRHRLELSNKLQQLKTIEEEIDRRTSVPTVSLP